MGRAPRTDARGMVFHILNRANGRMRLFGSERDYQALEEVLELAAERFPVGVLGWCLMPNHWHLVLRPGENGALSRFMHYLTLTHTQRWHAAHRSIGNGHLYQGRFKSFLVQADGHFLAVCRYVERNPLRAGLVARAEDWRWGSLWRRERGTEEQRKVLSSWPVGRPAGWTGRVNRAETESELMAIRECLRRGRPYGGELWAGRMVRRHGLEVTLRPRGRPRAASKKGS